MGSAASHLFLHHRDLRLMKPFDRKLADGLRQRDPEAMLVLYDLYGKLVYSVILSVVRDSAMAEDLTQEAFLRVWNRAATFDGEKGNLEGWLVTVARNRAFDYLRAQRNSPETIPSSLSNVEQSKWFASSDNHLDSVTNQKAVIKAMDALKPEQRRVIELTHFEGMTQTEIAEKLSKPLGTVKGLVKSALKTLRTTMVGAGLQ